MQGDFDPPVPRRLRAFSTVLLCGLALTTALMVLGWNRVPWTLLSAYAGFMVLTAGASLFLGLDRFVMRDSLMAGECPHCGYSLRGLPPGGVCPECGGSLVLDPEESSNRDPAVRLAPTTTATPSSPPSASTSRTASANPR